jgi:hypothetical protein
MAIVLTNDSINVKEKRIIHCKLYTVKSAQVILLYAYLIDVTLFKAPPISIVITPTIVLSECIVQHRYLFFVKLCFDNIMSIIMKVSYMKSNNCIISITADFNL